MKWIKRQILKRSPRSNSIKLKHSTVYVLPSIKGLLYWAAIVLVWLIGSNYENNLILAMAFFLLSLGLLSVFHGFNNLVGLTFTAKPIAASFAGEMVSIHVLCKTTRKSQGRALDVVVNNHVVNRIFIEQVGEHPILLTLPANVRGLYVLPQIKLVSTYPLGLFTLWSYLYFSPSFWVYPKPIVAKGNFSEQSTDNETGKIANTSGDDFAGFETYQQGDSLNKVAWKHYAKTGQLFIKKNVSYLHQEELWLDYAQCKGATVEKKLSELSYLVTLMNAQKRRYGLKMPHKTLAINEGEAHRHACLSELAIYLRSPLAVEWQF